tara:strand:+ start:38 stop:1750 length:1713 start_codon:yes stop_codon:yes gene_type:complete
MDPLSIGTMVFGGLAGYGLPMIFKDSEKDTKPYPEFLTELRYNILWLSPALTSLIDQKIEEDKHHSQSANMFNMHTINNDNSSLPAPGCTHYIWKSPNGWNNWIYNKINIGLYKHTKTTDRGQKTEFYILFSKKDQETKRFAKHFLNELFAPLENKIYVNSITTVNFMADSINSLITINRPRDYQINIARDIIESYNDPSTRRNITAMLYGPKGSGKSEEAYIIAKEMQERFWMLNENEFSHKKRKVRFYHDFNPNTMRVDINQLALRHIKESDDYVTILLINEIDIVYDKATSTKDNIMGGGEDGVFKHSKDKTSLNNLLDLLDRTDGLIVLFTTEKSPEEMAFNSENGKYQASFFREGRVKKMYKFTKIINEDPNNLDENFTATSEHIYEWKNRLETAKREKILKEEKKIKEDKAQNCIRKFFFFFKFKNLNNNVEKLKNKISKRNKLMKDYNKYWNNKYKDKELKDDELTDNKLNINMHKLNNFINYFLNILDNKHLKNFIFITLLYMLVVKIVRYMDTAFISIVLAPFGIGSFLLYNKENKKINKFNEREKLIEDAESVFKNLSPE